jgi:hypothetical protein
MECETRKQSRFKSRQTVFMPTEHFKATRVTAGDGEVPNVYSYAAICCWYSPRMYFSSFFRARWCPQTRMQDARHTVRTLSQECLMLQWLLGEPRPRQGSPSWGIKTKFRRQPQMTKVSENIPQQDASCNKNRYRIKSDLTYELEL